jgi:hypothetical protein
MRPKSKKRQELMDEKWNACLWDYYYISGSSNITIK